MTPVSRRPRGFLRLYMSAPNRNQGSPQNSPQPASDSPSIYNAIPSGPTGNTSRDILFPGTVVAHRFALKRLIGKGGMGVVWEVYDKTLGRDVALKFLGTEIASDLEAVTDLQRETRRSLELTHPNIVRVYDYVQDDEFQLVGISMELLTGQSLQTLKLQQPKWVFTPEVVSPWLRQICAALDYAHQTVGVVHRDLKPGNIFINDRGTLKIVDFGVAMVVRESTSHVIQEARLSRSGTLTYMSPQQLRGDKPTSADDLYSVGALLYELFTGKPPFFRGDPHALMLQVMTHYPVPIAQRQAEMGITDIHVPPAWEKAIMDCLSKEAAARPKSGAALLAMVEGTQPPVEQVPSVGASAVPFVAVDADKTLMQAPRLASLKPIATHPLLARPPLRKDASGTRPPFATAAPANGSRRAAPTGPSKAFIAIVVVGLLAIVSLFAFLRLEPPKPEVPFTTPLPTPGLTLRVDPSDANAQIQIDDRLPMVVPRDGILRIRDLADGDHIIIARAAGFEPFKVRTVLRNNRGELEIGLVALHGSIEVTGRPGSRVITRQADRPETVLGQIGPSGVATFADQIRLGETALRLEHPDCYPTDFRRFAVSSEEKTRVHLDQMLLPASLSVLTVPTGAEIFVDGYSRGKEPAGLNDLKSDTEIQVEVRLEGHELKRQSYTLKPREHREVTLHLQPLKGDVIVSARPGTRVFARRPGQTQIELGNVGPSGEESFSKLLTQGHWTLGFEHADYQPTSAVGVDIAQGPPTRVSAAQLPLPGSLDIRSEPTGAEIWMDGVKQGTTPAVIKALPAETPLAVELRLRGRTPVARTITLRPNERTTLLFDKFAQEYVYTRIDIQPWEKLRGQRISFSVDGVPVPPRSRLGSVVEMRLDAGSEHLLKVQAEGFRDRSITIDPSKDRVHRVTLEPLPAQVSIVSEPARALVWLNGVGPKEAPSTFSELTPGRYTLRVQKPGFKSYVQELVVGAGANLKIGPVVLAPDPARSAVLPSSIAQIAATPPKPVAPKELPRQEPKAKEPTPSLFETVSDAAIPTEAQLASTIKLSGHTRLEYIMEVVRRSAVNRGWTVAKSENNLVVLTLTYRDFDANLYLQCEPKGIEIYSDSYRAGILGRVKQIPTNWLRDLRADLARQLY